LEEGGEVADHFAMRGGMAKRRSLFQTRHAECENTGERRLELLSLEILLGKVLVTKC
jgi:hypothetical protein